MVDKNLKAQRPARRPPSQPVRPGGRRVVGRKKLTPNQRRDRETILAKLDASIEQRIADATTHLEMAKKHADKPAAAMAQLNYCIQVLAGVDRLLNIKEGA